MSRSATLRQVEALLGNRSLVWCGLRGEDAASLADVPQFDAAFSIVGAYAGRPGVDSLSLEQISGTRPDLELWDIEDHLTTEPVREFRGRLLRRLARENVLLPYRPSNFISSLCFTVRDHCVDLGRFGGLQSAFEHKPWVETCLAALGIPSVPWTYVIEPAQLRMMELGHGSAIVARRSRTSGGEGFTLFPDVEEVEKAWPHTSDGLVSVAPYIDSAVPVNIGAVVWTDGVTLHHPSVQLIGLEECVSRPFGYAGNDFGAARQLDETVLDEIERSTVAIGGWLRQHGYVGAFGVDFLVHDGRALFTEVNPRFQGSTIGSCRLAVDADESCILLDHVAAVLGLECPKRPPLRSRVSGQRSHALVVVHHLGSRPEEIDPTGMIERLSPSTDFVGADVLAPPGVVTEPGGVVARLHFDTAVTETGFQLLPGLSEALSTPAKPPFDDPRLDSSNSGGGGR